MRRAQSRRATLNRLLFPGPTSTFEESRETYSDLSVLPTTLYLYGMVPGEEYEVDIEEGKRLLLGVQAISEPDERGFRTVMSTLNGQLRPVAVRDRAVASDVPAQEKADTSKPGHVAAPFEPAVRFGRSPLCGPAGLSRPWSLPMGLKCPPAEANGVSPDGSQTPVS